MKDLLALDSSGTMALGFLSSFTREVLSTAGNSENFFLMDWIVPCKPVGCIQKYWQKNGYTGDVPMPDSISQQRQKAQEYIGFGYGCWKERL